MIVRAAGSHANVKRRELEELVRTSNSYRMIAERAGLELGSDEFRRPKRHISACSSTGHILLRSPVTIGVGRVGLNKPFEELSRLVTHGRRRFVRSAWFPREATTNRCNRELESSV